MTDSLRVRAPHAIDVMERLFANPGTYAGDKPSDSLRRIVAALIEDGWRVSDDWRIAESFEVEVKTDDCLKCGHPRSSHVCTFSATRCVFCGCTEFTTTPYIAVNETDRRVGILWAEREQRLAPFGRNGGVICDTDTGPCACGATHTEDPR